MDEKKKGNLRGNLGRGEDGGAWRHAFDEGLNGLTDRRKTAKNLVDSRKN